MPWLKLRLLPLLNKLRPLLLLFFSLVFCFASCNKDRGADVAKEEVYSEDSSISINGKIDESLHIYCFVPSPSQQSQGKSDQVLQEISSFETCPTRDSLPWTDSIRVSGMGFLSVAGLTEKEPCFVLNKVGVFSFKNALSPPLSFVKSNDVSQFTSGNLYNTDVGVLLHSYKTNTFNYINNSEENEASSQELPILSRYNSVTQELESILFPHHFALPSYATLISLHYNSGWTTSFKIDNGQKVQFRYFSFDNVSDILNAEYKTITQETFRDAVAPIRGGSEGYALLPQGLIQLINSTEEENISIEYFDKNYPSPLKILKTAPNAPELEDIDCQAIAYSSLDDDKVHYSILFNTGKLYVYYDNDKFPDVYLLPELPENFIYTYFAVHNNFVLAAWEEQEFYECKRTGIVVSPLTKLKKVQS